MEQKESDAGRESEIVHRNKAILVVSECERENCRKQAKIYY